MTETDTIPAAPAIDLDAREAFLRALMPRAAARAREGFARRDAAGFEMKGPQDFLTETDLAVEALIRGEIARAFPQDAILGEEGGGTPGRATWVIDPIDGTANFARGVPHFCVILAFCLEGECLLGAIHQPVLDDLYLARKGRGATKNGRTIRAAATPAMDAACIEMGWSRRHAVDPYLQAQRRVLAEGANIRRAGSGGLALAHVAEGCSDGYLEIAMNSWDCVAGLLMVEEAGGRVARGPAGAAGLAALRPVLAAAPALAPALAAASAAPVALKEPAA
ncbi:inositol monophosphatase family protein [Poseidonocella sp. HB161398]|uniref:inositol monophosphatase family protein n=1 Tax=Poseidonocella sp. HB161398 TaxID=2320855 RepID=UPI001F0D3AFC|nr:inositol monophosphatase family protein [Poseidonocella sp. HB161398]